MYQIQILEAAKQDLAKLPKSVAQRVISRIRWLGKNIDNINLEPLKGDLSRFYKLRMGDYRILYEILHKEQMIVIHIIGHRKDIYQRQKRK